MSRPGPRRRSVIIAILLTALALVSLEVRSGVVGAIGGGVREAFGLVSSGVSFIIRPVTGTIQGLTDARKLKAEIEELRTENERLSKEIRENAQLVREAKELRELRAVRESAESVEVAVARVVLASPNSLERVVTIDRGSSDGVKVGHAVLSPEGLAGIVEEVSPGTAIVRLITDNSSAVGVRVTRSGETGILKGTGRADGLLKLELVAPQAVDKGQVSSGDVLVTAGFTGGLYPPGIPVGQVITVDEGKRGGDANVFVRPAAGLSRLEFVSVVRPGSSERTARAEESE